MDTSSMVVALGVLVLLVHAAFAVYLYRSLSGSTAERAGSAPGEDPPVEPSGLPPEDRARSSGVADLPERPDDAGPSPDGTVQCSICGTPNDPQFQFCRRCVSELSGSGPPQGDREVTGG
ncbi:small CPxCG-related zinc finger protein [Natronomonas moolapensis 8.8.11]|jgi:hypothetical protein|uniref:Small CPxCG-related zinc finger protein n=1 Tax=Natronomonas moolapensis (strain DSM 18674 / CECT 7526 / JCM 14361 / 8.8.11) TaxID=268739 RepID=M1XRX5_NATM8|nr:hypothetical protein [Natronomonas moolapensis]CCQ37025.1 small CPxCG-related zinc finger protein [Natronomonas moolapensis 8.8.11]